MLLKTENLRRVTGAGLREKNWLKSLAMSVAQTDHDDSASPRNEQVFAEISTRFHVVHPSPKKPDHKMHKRLEASE
jgi:hypothetical protein